MRVLCSFFLCIQFFILACATTPPTNITQTTQINECDVKLNLIITGSAVTNEELTIFIKPIAELESQEKCLVVARLNGVYVFDFSTYIKNAEAKLEVDALRMLRDYRYVKKIEKNSYTQNDVVWLYENIKEWAIYKKNSK
ncbi:MAG: hypothetical protein Q8Q23_03565 [bacterium]|nr:hypothetical protein [bacterium]